MTVAVNVGLNAMLVQYFLAIGAAAARAIAMVVMVVTTFVLMQRLWPQRPDFLALARCATDSPARRSAPGRKG